MKEKIIIYESEYLAYEFMPKANLDFVLQEFKHLDKLEESETGWDSYPEWLHYFSIRPIGSKPYLTSELNLNVDALHEFLQSHHLTKVEKIEIHADEHGVYASELMNSVIYGNSDYDIIISAKENVAEYLCFIPSETQEGNDITTMRNLVGFFLDNYNLILVDWRRRAFI